MVQAPTLLIHAKYDRGVPAGVSRQMAELIPNATLVELDSPDHLPFYDRPDEIIEHSQTFLTGGAVPDLSESRVATLMFTDIVGSTERRLRRAISALAIFWRCIMRRCALNLSAIAVKK